MNLSFAHWNNGEKILFIASCLGAVLLVGLTVKATVETGVTPQYEQDIFTVTFLVTFGLTVGLLVSHFVNRRRSQEEENA